MWTIVSIKKKEIDKWDLFKSFKALFPSSQFFIHSEFHAEEVLWKRFVQPTLCITLHGINALCITKISSQKS